MKPSDAQLAKELPETATQSFSSWSIFRFFGALGQILQGAAEKRQVGKHSRGSRGAKSNRVARRRRRNQIARASRKRNRYQ